MGPFHAERAEVLSACHTLADEGFLPGTGGNIALRVDDRAFVVTPSGADYYSMTPDDLCVLKIDTLEVIAGERKPSVESGLHVRLLRRRPDIVASIHTHQPVASAVALLNRSIPVDDPSLAARLGSSIEIVPYAPSGTSFLASAFEKKIHPEVNAYLLRNHGVVCGGPSLEETIERVRLTEEAARRYLNRSMNSDRSPLVAQVRALLVPGPATS